MRSFPSLREIVQATGIEVPHLRSREAVLCPFHEEREPSFVLAHDKQEWYDSHTGESGNRWDLYDKLQASGKYDLSSLLPRLEKGSLYYEKEAGQVTAKIRPRPPDNGALADHLAQMGLEKKAKAARRCGKAWRREECEECPEVYANPLNCKSSFCGWCREKRIENYITNHGGLLASWGGCRVIRFKTKPAEMGRYWRSKLKEVWEKLAKKLPCVWKQVKRKEWLDGWLYQRRASFEWNRWRVVLYIFVPPEMESECRDYLKKALGEVGLEYQGEEPFEGPFGALEALRIKAGAPFDYNNQEQFEVQYELMKGKPLVQGVGNSFRRDCPPKAKEGGAKKREGRRCKACGARVRGTGLVSWKQVYWDIQRGHWTCPRAGKGSRSRAGPQGEKQSAREVPRELFE